MINSFSITHKNTHMCTHACTPSSNCIHVCMCMLTCIHTRKVWVTLWQELESLVAWREDSLNLEWTGWIWVVFWMGMTGPWLCVPTTPCPMGQKGITCKSGLPSRLNARCTVVFAMWEDACVNSIISSITIAETSLVAPATQVWSMCVWYHSFTWLVSEVMLKLCNIQWILLHNVHWILLW